MKNVLPLRFEVSKTFKQSLKSSTFLAADRLNDRPQVVVKILRRGNFTCDRDALSEFYEWYGGVRHVNLAQIFEVGLTSTQNLYCVREFCCETYNLTTDPQLLLGQLVDVLGFLHSKGRIHGRIRPSNLFFSNGIFKLADPIPKAAKLTRASEEDVRFDAPEILLGETPTIESDLYSFGALAYRVFSGKDPFDDFDAENLKTKYLWMMPRPLARSCHVSDSMSVAIAQLLSKDLRERRQGFDLVQRAFGRNASTATRAPLFGRSVEMERLRSVFEKPSGGLRAFIIEGEAGLGKTRLIEELQFRSGFYPCDFVVVRCPHETSRDLTTAVELASSLLSRRSWTKSSYGTELEPFRETLSRFLAPAQSNDGPGPSRTYPTQRIVSDLIGLIASLARSRPVIVAIEDVQWADTGTLQFLEQLSFRAAEVPISLICTRRPNRRGLIVLERLAECLDKRLEVFSLKPLEPQHARAMVGYLDNDPIRQEGVLNSAFGNPLFIQEYATYRKRFQNDAHPPGVVKLVSDALKNLTRPARLLGQVLSLFEEPVELNIPKFLSDLSGTLFEGGLRELGDAGLLELDEKSLRLRPSVVGQTLYKTISPSRKRHLHEKAYRLIAGGPFSDSVLANHAFEGRLYKEAAALYRPLAKSARERANYPEAIKFYTLLDASLTACGEPLPPTDQSDLAWCYGRIGRPSIARQILERLRLHDDLQKQPSLMAAVYVGLAGPDQSNSASDQIAILNRARESLPADTPQLIIIYILLSQALIRLGDLETPKKLLTLADRHVSDNPDRTNLVRVAATRALLLLHSSRFREAATEFHSIKCDNDYLVAACLVNEGLCSEHLGRLKEARHLQSKALAGARRIACASLEITALGNLAVVEGKLGNLTQADAFFKVASHLIERAHRRDSTFDVTTLSIFLADRVLFLLQCGRYREATETLAGIHLSSEPKSIGDDIHVALTKAQVLLAFENSTGLSQWRKETEKLSLSKTDFYVIERIVIHSGLETTTVIERIQLLGEALATSIELGTLYQRCKILVELSSALLASSRQEAESKAKEAEAIAKRHGYAPLLVRALMLHGLALNQTTQKAQRLALAFRMASQIGMPELVAESAFHIGAHQMSCGHHLTAKEYLLKSTSITSELVEQVPLKFRARYLAKSWRKEARRLLEECAKKVEPPLLALHGEPREAHQDERLFRGLYRLTVSAGVAKDVDTFISSLVQTLDTSIRRRAVVMLKRSGKIDWHPVRVKLSEDLIKRVATLSEKARGRIYFGGEKNPTKDTVAWIPFKSERCGGGVYVSCRPMEPALAERELEFLTILGTIASDAVDRIEFRSVEPPRISPAAEFHGMIGSSRVMREVYSQVEAAGRSATTVLIEGESGTGKELVARAIHKCSSRAAGPFIAVDCGAIPETLIESELFGSKKGAFTGAVSDRPGLFEAANKGTIFLDEIGNTSPGLQVKLLRVIQEREIRRIGETRGRPVDVRLITATNLSLDKLVEENRFRTDLLYRLKVLHIKLPPLRNRREDIPALAQTFLDRLNATHKTKKTFAPGFLQESQSYAYPGNIRELQNIVERAFFLATGSVITTFPIEPARDEPVAGEDVSAWFHELTEGRKNFWSAVHDKYKNRDISRQKVMALVDFGLKSTRGSYKNLASSFRLREKEYRRFMDFLRRNNCLLDFRPYRKTVPGP